MPKPAPSPPAARLRRRIAAAGPIPFAEFMEEALYGDGGYYAREELPIGVEGDYVTGSSHSPLFGRATARWLAALDRALGRRADFFEAGFGNGTHLAALVAALAAGGGLAGRRLLAWDRVPRPVPAGVERVEGPAALAARPVRGLVFSFELFDALPVHRLVGRQGGRASCGWGSTERGASSGGRRSSPTRRWPRSPARRSRRVRSQTSRPPGGRSTDRSPRCSSAGCW